MAILAYTELTTSESLDCASLRVFVVLNRSLRNATNELRPFELVCKANNMLRPIDRSGCRQRSEIIALEPELTEWSLEDTERCHVSVALHVCVGADTMTTVFKNITRKSWFYNCYRASGNLMLTLFAILRLYLDIWRKKSNGSEMELSFCIFCIIGQ